jgi:TRAP-type mannitol/chloroaromatic compound transport system permease small subunit
MTPLSAPFVKQAAGRAGAQIGGYVNEVGVLLFLLLFCLLFCFLFWKTVVCPLLLQLTE